MSKLVLVTPEGRIVSDTKPSEVEKHQETPLHVIAQRAAEQASTQSSTIKVLSGEQEAPSKEVDYGIR